VDDSPVGVRVVRAHALHVVSRRRTRIYIGQVHLWDSNAVSIYTMASFYTRVHQPEYNSNTAKEPTTRGLSRKKEYTRTPTYSHQRSRSAHLILRFARISLDDGQTGWMAHFFKGVLGRSVYIRPIHYVEILIFP
jgi:hypothetical protein